MIIVQIEDILWPVASLKAKINHQAILIVTTVNLQNVQQKNSPYCSNDGFCQLLIIVNEDQQLQYLRDKSTSDIFTYSFRKLKHDNYPSFQKIHCCVLNAAQTLNTILSKGLCWKTLWAE